MQYIKYVYIYTILSTLLKNLKLKQGSYVYLWTMELVTVQLFS